MDVKTKYDEKSGILTISCDRKDVILAFGNENNYKQFLKKLTDEIFHTLEICNDN